MTEERDAIVRWLRKDAEEAEPESARLMHGIANDIERGDHMETDSDT